MRVTKIYFFRGEGDDDETEARHFFSIFGVGKMCSRGPFVGSSRGFWPRSRHYLTVPQLGFATWIGIRGGENWPLRIREITCSSGSFMESHDVYASEVSGGRGRQGSNFERL